MAFNKNLVVAAGFTLALLVASSHGDFPRTMASSYGGMAVDFCYERTETKCTSEETCKIMCIEKGDPYVGGYCPKVALCVCIKTCDAQLPHGA